MTSKTNTFESTFVKRMEFFPRKHRSRRSVVARRAKASTRFVFLAIFRLFAHRYTHPEERKPKKRVTGQTGSMTQNSYSAMGLFALRQHVSYAGSL